MIAGLSAMKLSDELDIESHINVVSALMERRLKQIEVKSNFIGDVRVRGMMFGIEYVKNKKTKEPAPELAKKIRKFCYENGLLVEIGGYYNNVVRFLPPLIITKKIAENGLNIFEDANDNLLDPSRNSQI